jgi:hypothetical protein
MTKPRQYKAPVLVIHGRVAEITSGQGGSDFEREHMLSDGGDIETYSDSGFSDASG